MQDRRRAAEVGLAPAIAGRLAFDRGESPVDCPYVLETRRHRAWMVGWLLAFARKFDNG